MSLRLLAALAVAALPTVAAAEQGLAGSEWRPVSVSGAAFAEGVEAFVQFKADGVLTGRGGCNRFTGTYEIDGKRLAIGPVASTRMACPGPAMAAEAELFAAFQAVRSFTRERADLTFLDADGAPVAAFAQTDWD